MVLHLLNILFHQVINIKKSYKVFLTCILVSLLNFWCELDSFQSNAQEIVHYVTCCLE